MTNTEIIAVLTGKTAQEVLSAINSDANEANAFISTIMNKVILSKFYNVGFVNPMNKFKKGMLTAGVTIEQIYIQMAESVSYGGTTYGSIEADALRKYGTKVVVNYISKNIANRYSKTIPFMSIIGAFATENGLTSFVSGIYQSLNDALECDQYEYAKMALFEQLAKEACVAKALNPYYVVGGAYEGKVDAAAGSYPVHEMWKNIGAEVGKTNATDILITLKSAASRMGFPKSSEKYNLGRVKSVSKPEKLCLAVTPEVRNQLDVNALANLFNLKLADYNESLKVFNLDELPVFGTTYIAPGAEKVVDLTTLEYVDAKEYTIDTDLQGAIVDAIIFDEDMLEIWDQKFWTSTQFVAPTSDTNVFLNYHGIAAANPFKNFFVLYHKNQG